MQFPSRQVCLLRLLADPQCLPEDAGRIPRCWDLEELGWGLIVCVCVCVCVFHGLSITLLG
ncbi:hypothetical protein I7I50_03842 [Histoplasma capsulatum G186AR]|uniref:Uncharacterized protein n=1 Tax=Ajellomyces capsulatus TaxID=5037 RepID=A0A8H7YLS7_AJECA|nr:hypothetical protein I7I52_04750 [Histoplasma capsulatum]QSS74891.1 hypothetical protein I7I50_03842 [Histoplasma capsulatum G186AR]